MKRVTKRLSAAQRNAYLRGKLLETRQRLLENMVSGFAATVDAAENRVPADIADLANEAIARDATCEIGAVESNAVSEIDDALQRLDDGTYGICQECHQPISAARLKVLPFASMCVACKSHREWAERAESESSLTWEGIGAAPEAGGRGVAADSAEGELAGTKGRVRRAR